MKHILKIQFLSWGVLLVGLATVLSGCMSLGGPRVRIEVSPTTGVVPLTVQFDGTGSTGPGGITTYHWLFGTGDGRYEANGTYTYEHAGTFTLSLTVRAEDGSTATKTMTIQVDPAVWITDTNLARIYKLDMQGNVLLAAFDVPVSEPRGITIAEVDGRPWLFVACAGEGNPRILRMDLTDGDLDRDYSAPAHSPRSLTSSTDAPKRLWHVDSTSHRIYGLDPNTGQTIESFGSNYFSTSPQVNNAPFLWTPQGLDWTPESGTAGYLWYLEGENRLLYKIRIIPSYDIQAGTQLQVVGNPIQIPVFSASAIDIYDGFLWVVDVDNHEIVQVDLETGTLTGTKITGFPGASPAGLEIQH
jgi:PKD repeat protein